jgi:hypothetical protein
MKVSGIYIAIALAVGIITLGCNPGKGVTTNGGNESSASTKEVDPTKNDPKYDAARANIDPKIPIYPGSIPVKPAASGEQKVHRFILLTDDPIEKTVKFYEDKLNQKAETAPGTKDPSIVVMGEQWRTRIQFTTNGKQIAIWFNEF